MTQDFRSDRMIHVWTRPEEQVGVQAFIGPFIVSSIPQVEMLLRRMLSSIE